MSVYIPGMEMPTSCNECRFFVDAWCYALEVDDWRNAYNKPPEGERLDSCPLVPVPPHGRLIDADALLESEPAYTIPNYNSDGYLVDAEGAYTEVQMENAPTIVPADKEDT